MNNMIIDTSNARMNTVLAELAAEAARYQHHLMNTVYSVHGQLAAAERFHFYSGAAAYYEAKLARSDAMRVALTREAVGHLESWEELKALNAK